METESLLVAAGFIVFVVGAIVLHKKSKKDRTPNTGSTIVGGSAIKKTEKQTKLL